MLRQQQTPDYQTLHRYEHYIVYRCCTAAAPRDRIHVHCKGRHTLMARNSVSEPRNVPTEGRWSF